MLPVETLAPFFLASVLLALAPGPDNIFVLIQSALHGRLSGFAIVLGLCTGLICHTLAVTLGVAVIFQTSSLAFTGLKIFGVCYLLYLACKAFRASSTPIEAKKERTLSLGRLYRRGIVMNITNPKVSLFFLAFLPQFANPAMGSLGMQMLLLGLVFILATILVFGAIALLAGSLKNSLNQSNKVQKIMNRVAGTIFVGLALKLLTTTQR